MAFHIANKRKVAEEYFVLQEEFEKKYGKDTVVIILVGNFFEVYGIDNEIEKIGQLDKISELLSIQKTRANKKIIGSSRSNPAMCGFPEVSLDKYVKILVENEFTVVVVGQEDHPDKKIKTKVRKVKQIFSKGTYIENNIPVLSNNLVCILLEYNIKAPETLMQFALSMIDLSTGKSQIILIEAVKIGNIQERQTQKIRVAIQSLAPRELIVYTVNYQGTIIDLENLLQINNIKPHYYLECVDKVYWKLSYQNTFLEKYFTSNLISVIEYLGLEKYPASIVCFMLMLQFAYDHDNKLLLKLEKPSLIQTNENLELSINCIQQLHLIPSTFSGQMGVNSSLFSILDQTSTSLGKRLLKERILNPLISSKKINERYLEVEKMFTKVSTQELWELLEPLLNNVKDLERLHRRISLKRLQPAEFSYLHESYEQIQTIITTCIHVFNPFVLEDEDEYNHLAPVSKVMTDKVIKKFNKFRKWYCSQIHLDNIQKFNLDDNFTAPIFLPGIHKEIDDLLVEVALSWKSFQELSDILANKIGTETKYIRVDSTNTEGYYLSTSVARGKLLIKYQDEYNLQFTKLTSTYKVTSPKIKKYSDSILKMQTKLNELNIEKYMLFLDEINENYTLTLKTLAKYIALLDLNKSIAKVARKNKYVKPEIVENEDSFFEVEGLRHPIIERINTLVPYVGNDIVIGKEMTGMLLFGLNFSGKCLAPTQEILMYNGTIKLAKDVIIGDLLMGEDSTKRTVTNVCAGIDEMFEIIPSKGKSYIVNSAHILTLKSSGPTMNYRSARDTYVVNWFDRGMVKSKNFKEETEAMNFLHEKSIEDRVFDISLQDFINIHKKSSFLAYGFHVGVEFPVQDLPMDPYLFGYWLGDGTSNEAQITTSDPEIVNVYKLLLQQYDLTLSEENQYSYNIINCQNSKNLSLNNTTRYNGLIEKFNTQNVSPHYIVKYKNNEIICSKQFSISKYANKEEAKNAAIEFLNSVEIIEPILKKNPFANFLKKYNLLNNKHIPLIYRVNSRENRLKLLAGLIDSDGYCAPDRNMLEITQKSIKLTNDIEYLAFSLGFMVTHKEIMKICTNSKEKIPKPYQRLFISGRIQDIPCILFRKTNSAIANNPKNTTHTRLTVKSLGKGKYNGFTLDGNGRFLLNDFTVTHNSTYIRSVGLGIIMAQCGFYVAAMSLKFTPFKKIITKIAITDNLFLSQSTFIVEMKELKNMLTYGDQYSLILADELSSGSHHTGAISIVGSSILNLMRNRANFIFTSHIHELVDIPELKKLDKLKAYHLDVANDNGKLVFNRKLKLGICEREYAIEICQYLQMDNQFILDAIKIRRELKSENKEIVSVKTSNYNKNVYVNGCHVCKSNINLNTHHIVFQEKFTPDNKISFNKNIRHNLTILCFDCHKQVHDDKIIIHGYNMTSNGVELNYTRR